MIVYITADKVEILENIDVLEQQQQVKQSAIEDRLLEKDDKRKQ